ncbi:MAG TPA: hypothetical protein PKX94_08720, partial [Opitutales bacterium]|nr:hypothetical protein [Opitutales bacterium]
MRQPYIPTLASILRIVTGLGFIAAFSLTALTHSVFSDHAALPPLKVDHGSFPELIPTPTKPGPTSLPL